MSNKLFVLLALIVLSSSTFTERLNEFFEKHSLMAKNEDQTEGTVIEEEYYDDDEESASENSVFEERKIPPGGKRGNPIMILYIFLGMLVMFGISMAMMAFTNREKKNTATHKNVSCRLERKNKKLNIYLSGKKLKGKTVKIFVDEEEV